jgi:hypothetical protein
MLQRMSTDGLTVRVPLTSSLEKIADGLSFVADLAVWPDKCSLIPASAPA